MKKLSIQTISILVISMLFLSANHVKYAPHYFMAYIVQDGVILPIDEHVVKVKKKPFVIVLDMPDKSGVFVNAAFQSSTFNSALRNAETSSLKGFDEVAMYESWGNPLAEVLISQNRPMFWFIDSRANNRFSDYEHVNERYLCNRNVKVFYDTKEHVEIPIQQMRKPVFITFLKFSAEGENYRKKELMRHEFKIEWID
jgi:hypothetical protein